jgi:hypothetical protein
MLFSLEAVRPLDPLDMNSIGLEWREGGRLQGIRQADKDDTGTSIVPNRLQTGWRQMLNKLQTLPGGPFSQVVIRPGCVQIQWEKELCTLRFAPLHLNTGRDGVHSVASSPQNSVESCSGGSVW